MTSLSLKYFKFPNYLKLQSAFAKKQLKPGLNIQLEKTRNHVNDEPSLKRKFKEFYLNLDWIERMDLIVENNSLLINDLQSSESCLKDLANHDFKRECLFLRQAEVAISLALPRLNSSNVQTSRPDDYFAQMSKSDDHMKRIKENLLSKHAETEKRDKIRKLREMKKLGKSIQNEVEKKKLQAKKKLSDSIKKFKKGDKESLNIELESNNIKKKIKKKKEIKINEPPRDDEDSYNKKSRNTVKAKV